AHRGILVPDQACAPRHRHPCALCRLRGLRRCRGLPPRPDGAPRIAGKGPGADAALRAGRGDYTAIPTRAPMPAVNAMAIAPQKVTRRVAVITLAPPALAPTAPSSAKKNNEAVETAGTR